MIPELIPFLPIPELRDAAAMIRMAYEGQDLAPDIARCEAGIAADIDSVADWMDLGLLYQLADHRDHAIACQTQGLTLQQVFRNRLSAPPRLRLLVFVAPGDLMTNTPIDLLLEGQQVDIIRLFVQEDQPLPAAVPDHDLAFLAISEAPHTKNVLKRLASILPHWPRPVLNKPMQILELGRDRLFRLLEGAAGITVPPTWRATAEQVRRDAPAALPLIIRPIASHAGDGLEMMDHPDHIEMYLKSRQETDFYLSPFIDYASKDGGFRKYRLVFFNGRAHVAHLAVGDYWMVHYLNAGMAEDAAKRAEEEAVMAQFEQGFASRHAAALAELMRRVGLDYFILDCSETADGQLLIFEASVAMIVHGLDSQAVFPYKKPHMQALFTEFRDMLLQRVDNAKRHATAA